MLKNQAFNFYIGSQYTVHGLRLLETIPFSGTANCQILQLFIQQQYYKEDQVTVPNVCLNLGEYSEH